MNFWGVSKEQGSRPGSGLTSALFGFYLMSMCISGHAEQFLSGQRIRWDTPAQLASPGGKWLINVNGDPASSREETGVVLKERREEKSVPLFVFDRQATVFWGGERALLVLNAPGAGREEILFFHPSTVFDNGDVTSSGELDKSVRRHIEARIGRGRDVGFYVPRVKAWNGDTLVLAIGGTAVPKAPGSMAAYCYLFTVDTKRRQVIEVRDMGGKTARGKSESCQIFP